MECGTAWAQRGPELVPDHDLSYADVLVVDSYGPVRTSTSEILRTTGYTVAEAEDDLTALAVLDCTGVGSMVVDIEMSLSDAMKLRQMFGHLTPELLGSPLHLDATAMSEGVGGYVFLRKPVPPGALLSAVARALGRSFA